MPDGPGDKRQREYHYTGDHAKLDNPNVAHRVSQRADKGSGDNQVPESEPIGAIGQPGILPVGSMNGVVNGDDPVANGSGSRVGGQKMKLGFDRECGDAAKRQADDKKGYPNADAEFKLVLRHVSLRRFR